MKLRPLHGFQVVAEIILIICAPPPLLAQKANISIPFVGCASSGQVRVLKAPKGTNRLLPISAKDAQALAYYRSADGLGVLAPRGWHCEGVSGSGGYALYVSPKPMNRRRLDWEGFDGPGIEVSHITSDASGRYEIAEIMTRVFPAYRAFARRTLELTDLPVPDGPYAHDALTYFGEKIVEYVTPAQTEGLGTHFSWLRKNEVPVAGAAVVMEKPIEADDSPDMVLLSMRHPRDLARLTPVIVHFVEGETVSARRK